MKYTSLCYIRSEGKYLMLHRVKKENDENKDKWVGIGGKFEEGESPEDCVLREVREETGLTLLTLSYRGIVTFVSNEYGTEYMHLFTSDHFTGTLTACDEGILKWIPVSKVNQLPAWEGDRIFLDLISGDRPFFSLKLCYDKNRLTSAVLDGKPIFGSGVSSL
jgi:8-oxo-dGTP diphosphatase